MSDESERPTIRRVRLFQEGQRWNAVTRDVEMWAPPCPTTKTPPSDGAFVELEHRNGERRFLHRPSLEKSFHETFDDQGKLTVAASDKQQQHAFELLLDPAEFNIDQLRVVPPNQQGGTTVCCRPNGTSGQIQDAAEVDRFECIKIHDAGPAKSLMNIVLVSEGFTWNQLPRFRRKCNEFFDLLRLVPWFDALLEVINVFRIDVPSAETGVGQEESIGGVFRCNQPDTYFKANFCDTELKRQVSFNEDLLADVIGVHVPQNTVGALLINHPRPGGTAPISYPVVAATLPETESEISGNPDWFEYILHEIGHAAFGLADEYDYRRKDHAASSQSFYAIRVGDLVNPNVTDNTNPAEQKWQHLLDHDHGMPAMKSPNSAGFDRRTNPLDLAVGLFEGAYYSRSGVFRPSYTCRMRELHRPFCRVCVEAIHDTLRHHFNGPRLAADVQRIDLGSLVVGGSWQMRFEIANIGIGDIGQITATIDSQFDGFEPSIVHDLQCDPNKKSKRIFVKLSINTRVNPAEKAVELGEKYATLFVECAANRIEIPVRVKIVDFRFSQNRHHPIREWPYHFHEERIMADTLCPYVYMGVIEGAHYYFALYCPDDLPGTLVSSRTHNPSSCQVPNDCVAAPPPGDAGALNELVKNDNPNDQVPDGSADLFARPIEVDGVCYVNSLARIRGLERKVAWSHKFVPDTSETTVIDTLNRQFWDGAIWRPCRLYRLLTKPTRGNYSERETKVGVELGEIPAGVHLPIISKPDCKPVPTAGKLFEVKLGADTFSVLLD